MSSNSDSGRPSPLAIIGVVVLVVVVCIGGYLMMRSASRGDIEGVQLTPHPFTPPAGYKPGGARGATMPKTPGSAPATN